jgi:hypothetical protein
MAWDPDFMSEAERRAAKAIVRMQIVAGRLSRMALGPEKQDALEFAYTMVDDMLAMMYEDLYGSADPLSAAER